ncbi:MAG: hypothetical protein JEY99_07005 [Spirochaetales bacterium]|nr:hypothetical protein [Spirochaetales bacterium]
MHKKILLTLLIITAVSLPLTSLELGTYFNIGNMSFLETPLTTTTFSSDKLPWGASVTGTQNVGEGLVVDFGFDMDPILNNYAYGIFTYTGEFFSMGAGPAFGLFNTTETKMQPGISTNFKLELPGLAFVSFDLLSSIGYKMSSRGDYNQNESAISLGFYIPNAICTLNLVEKSYNEIVPTYGQMEDSILEYSFKSQIYKKNIPFSLLIGLIYRSTGNSYVTEELTTTGDSSTTVAALGDSLVTTISDVTLAQKMNSIILQTKIDFALTSWLTMVIDVNSSIFAFGSIDDEAADTKESLKFDNSKPFDSYMFQASLGFRIDMDNLNNL